LQPGSAGPARSSRHESGSAGNDQQVAANGQAPAPQQTPNPGQLEAYQAQNTGKAPVAAGTPNAYQQNQRVNSEQPNQSGGAHHRSH
jgi:hypothetical protein